MIRNPKQALKGLPVNPRMQVLAVLMGIMPVFTFVVLAHLQKSGEYSLKELLLFPLFAGAGSLIWILAVYFWICRCRPSGLNRGKGKLWADCFVGLALGALFVLLGWVNQFTIYRWLPSRQSGDIGTLISGLVNNPFLLAAWLGPVVWIGVAAFEEVSRAFILDRLWTAWPKTAGRWITVFISVTVFSAAHIYQGMAGMASVAVMSFISALYYAKFGRIWPLIVSHAVYDSFWIVFFIFQIRGN